MRSNFHLGPLQTFLAPQFHLILSFLALSFLYNTLSKAKKNKEIQGRQQIVP